MVIKRSLNKSDLSPPHFPSRLYLSIYLSTRHEVQLRQDRHSEPGNSLWLQLCDAVWEVAHTNIEPRLWPLVCFTENNSFWCGNVLSRYAFSMNGQPTMVPIPNSNISFGKATQMSQNDITRINKLYQCCEFSDLAYRVVLRPWDQRGRLRVYIHDNCSMQYNVKLNSSMLSCKTWDSLNDYLSFSPPPLEMRWGLPWTQGPLVADIPWNNLISLLNFTFKTST